MPTYTLGQLLINEALPEDMRDMTRVWNKKTTQQIMTDLANKHPERYRETAHKLMRIGQSGSTTGNVSFSLSDFLPSEFKKRESAKLNIRVQQILDGDGDRETKNTKVVGLLGDQVDSFVKRVLEDGVSRGSRLAELVHSGAKGSPGQYNTTVGAPLLFTDHRGSPIPIPVLRSAAEGLDPVEFFASSYGTRHGVISTKFATQDAGAFSKQLGRATHRIVVTEDDCETSAGIVVDGYDDENIGTVLSRDIAGFTAGQLLDPEAIRQLKGKKIVVRSPATCQAQHGICARCSGVRERGTFPEIGDNIGLPASQALSERISQGSLNVKHCLLPWTLVLMGDWSVRRLDELSVGDIIMGSDLEGNLSPTRVVDIYDNGVQDCYNTSFIPTSSHKHTAIPVVMGSTLEHKLLATRFVYSQDEEAQNGEIQPIAVGQTSKSFYAACPNSFDDTGCVNEPTALLCGSVLGDGCPPDVHTWDNESVANLIAGYVIADGSVYTDMSGSPGISIPSTNKKTLEEVRYLLGFRFGIWFTEPTCISEPDNPERLCKHELWAISAVQYRQVARFAERIPLHGVKRDKLKEVLENYPEPGRTVFNGLRRISQEFIGRHPTLDIQVDNDSHMFVLANGLIVSNSGGASGGKRQYTFEDIDRFFQMPKHFPRSAVSATLDGTVQEITRSDAGGAYVTVNGKKHYVENYEDITVKPGDHVEAGDSLSDGIINPKELASYRGVGAARRSFISELLRVTNNGVSRRNAEVIARGVVSHVRVNDLDGPSGTFIGDLVRYDDMVRDYTPRDGASEQTLTKSIGKYLEKPVLHYTIGTKVSNRVLSDLKEQGINSIHVHDRQPAFAPDVQRIYGHTQADPDWMVRLSGTELKRSLLSSVHEGAGSETHSTSYVPSIARGVDFGKEIDETGRY